MTDGLQSQTSQSFAFHAVVDDVAQAEERVCLRQFALRFADGGGDAEAETGGVFNFDEYGGGSRVRHGERFGLEDECFKGCSINYGKRNVQKKMLMFWSLFVS